MKKRLLSILTFILYCLLFSSCNSGDHEQTQSSDGTAATDPELQKLLNLFKTDLTLPFTADSAFLQKEYYGDSIGTAEMKLLAAEVMKHDELGSLDYDLPEFYKIDSIKATGNYKAWCETLDIGMTKFSKAEAVGKIKYNNDTDLLIWMLRQSSYEACPWSNVRTIYMTPVRNNKIGQTSVLAEQMGAGDPPVSMQRTIYGTINKDGSIGLDWREEHDDMDTTFSELETRKYDLMLKDKNISVIKEFKEQMIRIPHPKEEE